MVDDSVVLERRFISEGTLVVKEGEEANCAYLIQSGSVLVYTKNKSKTIELGRLGAGQIFGETALIFDEQRTASVKALEDCNLIAITRKTLKQKLQRSDPTVQAIVEMLTQRVISSNKAMIKKQTNVSDMMGTIRAVYKNIFVALPEEQREAFQSAVLPKMDDFLAALRDFQEKGKS